MQGLASAALTLQQTRFLLQPIYDTHGSKFEDESGNEYEDEGAAASCCKADLGR
jgi:hypothetical protein